MPYLDDAPRPVAMAHRGGALLAANHGIENTLAAFRRAHALGFRYLETDVHVSADGVVYAFHDLDLRRMTGEPTAIGDVDSTLLDTVRLGAGEPIPRLVDLLGELPDCRFNVDVKSDAAVEPTIAVLRAADALDRVCIGSFSHRRLARVRALEPRLATSMSPPEVAALRLGPVRAVWGWGARRGARCVQVPPRRGAFRVVTPGVLRRTRALGHPVHVWTIDDPDEMHALLDLGVDGIVTDRPDVLRDVLRSRGEWTETA